MLDLELTILKGQPSTTPLAECHGSAGDSIGAGITASNPLDNSDISP